LSLIISFGIQPGEKFPFRYAAFKDTPCLRSHQSEIRVKESAPLEYAKQAEGAGVKKGSS